MHSPLSSRLTPWYLVASGLLCGALLSASSIAPARSAALPGATAESRSPALQPSSPTEVMSQTALESQSAIPMRPLTKQQCCIQRCNGIKGASGHSKCMHNCMAGKSGC